MTESVCVCVCVCAACPQTKILKMMEDNNQLAGRIDAAVQSASQEVTNLRSELTATSRRLAQLGATETAATPPPDNSPTHTIHGRIHRERECVYVCV